MTVEFQWRGVTVEPLEIGSGKQAFRVVCPLLPYLEPVNLFLFETEDGFLLVDAGVKTRRCFRALEEGLGKIGIAWGDLKHLVITHCHVDHAGLAQGIRDKADVTTYGHSYTLEQVRQPPDLINPQDHPAFPFYSELGLPHDINVKMFQIENYMQDAFSEPVGIDRIVGGGDVIEIPPYRFLVVETPGHCPGHLSLIEDQFGVCVAGDVLHRDRLPPCPPPIYPATPLYLEALKEEMPHDSYVEGLALLKSHAKRAQVRLVLPGHGAVFGDLEAVLQGYVQRLEGKLESLQKACRTPKHVYELTRELHGELADMVTWLTVSQTLHVLIMLWRQQAMDVRRNQDRWTFISRSPGVLAPEWRALA